MSSTSYLSSPFQTFPPELQDATILRRSDTMPPGPLAYTIVGPLTVEETKSLTSVERSGRLTDVLREAWWTEKDDTASGVPFSIPSDEEDDEDPSLDAGAAPDP